MVSRASSRERSNGGANWITLQLLRISIIYVPCWCRRKYTSFHSCAKFTKYTQRQYSLLELTELIFCISDYSLLSIGVHITTNGVARLGINQGKYFITAQSRRRCIPEFLSLSNLPVTNQGNAPSSLQFSCTYSPTICRYACTITKNPYSLSQQTPRKGVSLNFDTLNHFCSVTFGSIQILNIKQY